MQSHESSSTTGLIPLDWWTKQIKRSPATVWRWRRMGWLKTITIANRRYIKAEDAEEFIRRASEGEFSTRKQHNPNS